MFFNFVLDAAEHARAPLARRRYIPFKSYPIREYNELVDECAAQAFPTLEPRDARRLIGQFIYPAFAQTLVGTAIFAVAGHDLQRVIEVAPRAYAVSIDPGRVSVVASAGHALVQLREIWTYVDSLHCGIFEGAIQRCGVQGRVDVKALSDCDADFEIVWTA